MFSGIIIVLLIGVILFMNVTTISKNIDRLYIDYLVEGPREEILMKQSDIDWLNKNFEIYENEFAVCMEESLYKGEIIQEATRTAITNVSETSVSLYCRSEDEWILHSHPNGYCSFSETDLGTLENSSMEYMGLICDVDYLKVINRDRERVEVKVIQ